MEVHRLGGWLVVLAGIAREFEWSSCVDVWLPVSRFAEVARRRCRDPELGPDASALYHSGWAKDSLGDRQGALVDYDQALDLYRTTNDRDEAATLNNIGARARRLR